MKKATFFAGVVVGIVLTLMVGFVCAIPYIGKNFLRCVHVNTPVEERLRCFGYGGETGLPEGSSRHYFFMEGFRYVDEFWSFELPPDQMEDFVGEYVRNGRIPPVDPGDLPPTVTHPMSKKFADWFDEWRPEYWFSHLSELDAVYFKRGESNANFAAYSKKNGRVYFMTWDL